MDHETVRTETKNIAIYIVSQRFKEDSSWQCRLGRYGRIVLHNVIDIYDQNNQELRDMMKRLNCTTTTCVDCFQSILNKMFADERCNWGRVLTAYTFVLTLAIWLEEHGVKQFNEFGGVLGDAINENIASWVREQNGWDRFIKHIYNN